MFTITQSKVSKFSNKVFVVSADMQWPSLTYKLLRESLPHKLQTSKNCKCAGSKDQTFEDFQNTLHRSSNSATGQTLKARKFFVRSVYLCESHALLVRRMLQAMSRMALSTLNFWQITGVVITLICFRKISHTNGVQGMKTINKITKWSYCSDSKVIRIITTYIGGSTVWTSKTGVSSHPKVEVLTPDVFKRT